MSSVCGTVQDGRDRGDLDMPDPLSDAVLEWRDDRKTGLCVYRRVPP